MFGKNKKRKSQKAAASNSEWEEFNPKLFQTNDQSDNYEEKRMHNRRVAPGRPLTTDAYSHFENYGFLAPFIEQEWLKVISLNVPYYPKMVQYFYNNIVYEKNANGSIHAFKSYVNGVAMRISKKVLAQVLEAPNEGKRINSYGAWNETHFTRAKQIQTVCGLDEEEDAQGRNRLSSNHLTVQARFLHHMLFYNILPKGGHRETVTYFDMELLTHLLLNEKVNLPYLIFNHMLTTAESSNRNLPYGMILTVLFEHFNVNLSEEVGLRISRQEFYTVSSLKKMGFELRNGEYVRVNNAHGGDDDDDDDEGDEGARDEPMAEAQSSTPPITLQRVWERMDGMYEYMGQMSTQMTGMHEYMGQMTAQMSTMQVTVNEMRDEWRSFSGRYMHPTTSDHHHASTTNKENVDEREGGDE
ncbi:unnamed protein product [Linum trigynum]|uniref:Putative plant transposon protein domain-containing protein n=1 Tax=Linum trigynum TaxID=586398 RepID=A0AAV2D9X0_9ROSI